MSLYNSTPGLDQSIKDIIEAKNKTQAQQAAIAIAKYENKENNKDTNEGINIGGSIGDLGDKEYDMEKRKLSFKIKKHDNKRWDDNMDKMAARQREIRMQQKESKDTPGNGYAHQCAVHVKSEQFGEGKTLFSQHAEPDVNGNIAWYDVMFEEGIKRVNTQDIEIIVSENHKNHKKMAEEVDLDEGRGRPRKTGASTETSTESEPDQNIVNHLKKSIDTGGNHEVKFDDKSSHKVPAHVAHKVLSAMGKLKPQDRLEVQKHIQQNHKNLMHVHGMVK